MCFRVTGGALLKSFINYCFVYSRGGGALDYSIYSMMCSRLLCHKDIQGFSRVGERFSVDKRRNFEMMKSIILQMFVCE